jgi:hypothetical protein
MAIGGVTLHNADSALYMTVGAYTNPAVKRAVPFEHPFIFQ